MSEPIPTIEEARRMVEEGWQRDYQAALDAAAHRIVADAGQRARLADYERQRQADAEAERERVAKDAAKAWKAQFGRNVARALKPDAEYLLLTVPAHGSFAYSDRAACWAAWSALLDAGLATSRVIGENAIQAPTSQRGVADLPAIPAVSMDPRVRALAVVTSQAGIKIEAVDPPAARITKIAAEQRERAHRAHLATIEQRDADLRRQREEARFGVEVSSLPEAE